MEDMLYPPNLPNPTGAKGGAQKGRNYGQTKPDAASIAQFHSTVIIVPQLADQQAAAYSRIRHASALIEAEDSLATRH